MCLLSSVEFLCLEWRNDAVWFRYLVLKHVRISNEFIRAVRCYLSKQKAPFLHEERRPTGCRLFLHLEKRYRYQQPKSQKQLNKRHCVLNFFV